MKYISTELIKNSILPFDFYQHTLPCITFNQHEWNDGGLCPFHDDKTKGSFRVNLQTGAFVCFSCGVSGGDIIAFERLLNDIRFPEALEKLASDWGVA